MSARDDEHNGDSASLKWVITGNVHVIKGFGYLMGSGLEGGSPAEFNHNIKKKLFVCF